MEMKEVEYVKEDKKDYASKGMAGTALGLGIAGTALGLGLFNGNGGGLFGGNSTCNGPTAYQVEQKECADALALTKQIYDSEIREITRFNDARQVINQEMFGIYKSQIDADFNLYKSQRDGFDVLANRISGLETQVAINAAVMPYQNKLIQCEIDRAYTAGINYTDQKTCRMIKGSLVLPNTPVVTGFAGSCQCPCNVTAATV